MSEYHTHRCNCDALRQPVHCNVCFISSSVSCLSVSVYLAVYYVYLCTCVAEGAWLFV